MVGQHYTYYEDPNNRTGIKMTPMMVRPPCMYNVIMEDGSQPQRQTTRISSATPRRLSRSAANSDAPRPLATEMGGTTTSLERRSCAYSPLTETARTLAGDRFGLYLMDGRSRTRLDKVGHYRVGKAIGRGNFATVRLARHEIAKTKVALKIIDKTLIDEDNMVKIEREIRILKTLDHPHIVKLYEVIRTDRYIYIATEYCTGGELYETLIERGRTSEDEARRLFYQTSDSLQYLHQRGIVHRDLKAENILLDKNNDIKIIDFGFSNIQQKNELLRTWCGSPPYAAPELLLGKEYDGMKADIWSLGVLLYILVTGGFPFPGDSVDKLKRAVLSGQVKIPYWVSVECSDLIRKMLVLNPAKRYGIHHVLQHRWMAMGTAPKPSVSLKSPTNCLLATSSLVGTRQRLNPTILMFMQTHGKWTEEQVMEAVFNRDYNSAVYGTYELLCDKVGRDNLEAAPPDDHPRRGSRGSIISGKAVVDTETLTPTISAHQLAQLNLSSPSDSESDDSSSSEMCDDSPCSSSYRRPKTRNRGQFGAAMNYDATNKNEHRRHTLCASEQILSPDMVAQLPIGSPLHQAALNHAAMAALAARSGANPLFPHLPIIPGLANVPTVDYARMLPVPNNERRASAGENLLQPGIENLGKMVGQSSVDEEGQGYLSKFGGKRNTVHGAVQLGPSSPVARHARNPYSKAPSTERRSSWASPTITTQQQAQLEMIYKQAIGGNPSDLFSIQNLQKEFQQLGKLTNSAAARSPTSVMGPGGAMFGCPRISITDEHNRSTLAAGSSSFDPVGMFEQKANEVVYGQRPATVCGFSSVPSCKSGTSSPEQTSRSMDSRVKSFVSSLPVGDLVNELKSSLLQMKIQFQETNEVVYMDHEMRRLSLSAGVEIGVAVLPPDDKSHVEFAILSSDSPTSELVCDELMNRLRIRDPAGTLE